MQKLHYFSEIFKGGVEIVSNQKLCFMDTINWNEVLYSPASIQVKVENNADFCGIYFI